MVAMYRIGHMSRYCCFNEGKRKGKGKFGEGSMDARKNTNHWDLRPESASATMRSPSRSSSRSFQDTVKFSKVCDKGIIDCVSAMVLLGLFNCSAQKLGQRHVETCEQIRDGAT